MDVSLAAGDTALVAVAAQLGTLTQSLFSLTPAMQAALRAKLDPGALLALSALTDRAGDLARAAAAEEAAGGARGLLEQLGRDGAARDPAPEVRSLPVPNMYYPSARHAKPARLSWTAWHQLWHEGIFASMSSGQDAFQRTRKCPPLRLALEQGDLTWSRDEANQPALSKAILLCRLLNVVVDFEVQSGKTPSEAVAAASERFSSAWKKSKEYALKGARCFFKDNEDAKYAGEPLTDFYQPPAKGGRQEGDDDAL